VVTVGSPPGLNWSPLGGAAQGVEAHGCAACSNAIPELGRKPVADQHAKRLARARNVVKPGVELIEIEQSRMSL
jgi:hypothetical protein